LLRYPNILEGDYSNFGPQADSSVAAAALQNIVKWYEAHGASDEHILALRTMNEEFINGLHICKSELYHTTSGIISGSFATAEVNSEINKIYIRLAWLDITGLTMRDFHDHVTLYVYGDDMIACVSDLIIDKFNVKTISEFFARHNINFTNASKGLEIVPYIKLEEATFLKRGFNFDPEVPNQCLANLDKISIEDQLNWVKRGGDKWDLTKQSMDSALRSATQWGRKYYNELQDKIKAITYRESIDYSFVDFDSIIQTMYYSSVGRTPSGLANLLGLYKDPASDPDRSQSTFALGRPSSEVTRDKNCTPELWGGLEPHNIDIAFQNLFEDSGSDDDESLASSDFKYLFNKICENIRSVSDRPSAMNVGLF